MIKCLSPIGQPLQIFPSFAAKKAQEKAVLMQRIGRLRRQMTELRDQTNQIQKDQTEMRQTAVLIQQDQEEIEKGQENLKACQDQIDQNALQVRQNHKQIKLQTIILEQKWKTLFPQTIRIQADQKELQVKLQGIEQKRDDIHQHALIIHQNIPMIQQNLQDASQAMVAIPHQVERIQQEHQAMKEEVKAIEEKRDNIRHNIPRLVEAKRTEGVHLKQFEEVLPFSECQKPINGASFDLCSSLLTKIKGFSLWILLELGYQLEQAHQQSKKAVASTSFSNKGPLTTSCIALIALGILTRNSIPEIKVSLEDLKCEGSFFLFKWKYQFKNLSP